MAYLFDWTGWTLQQRGVLVALLSVYKTLGLSFVSEH
jgi:hypothetical protein